MYECVGSLTSSPSHLPGGVGVLDPCEHETVDASAAMTPQEREDVTAAAQVRQHTQTHIHGHLLYVHLLYVHLLYVHLLYVHLLYVILHMYVRTYVHICAYTCALLILCISM